MAGDGKRRLKVLQPSDDDGPERPPWHWSVIGGVAILLAWLPLAYLAQLWAASRLEALGSQEQAAEVFRRLTPLERLGFAATSVLGPIVSLAIAAALGGALVGRFGGAAGKNEAMAAGLGVGVFAALLAAPQHFATRQWDAWAMSSTVVMIAGAVCARGGAWLALRRRPL
jgi:hypothetical protein